MNHVTPLLLVPLLALSLSLRSQDANPSFADVTEQAGIEVKVREPFLAFGDYDADGDPDLLVGGRRLFRNESTSSEIRFVDVTEEVGLAAARGPSGCWFDFDLDGHLDFGTTSGEVWINDGRGHFKDFTIHLGIVLPHGSASAIAWGDIDGDGWIDLFTGGNNRYDPSQHFAQTCWFNTRRRRPLARLRSERDLAKIEKMRDTSAELGIDRPMYGRSVVICDYDWDGDADVYSGNYHLKPNFLYRNDAGKLTDVATEAGVTGVNDPEMFTIASTGQKIGYRYGHTIGASWADLDNDGYFDLWVSNLVHKYVGPAPAELAKALGSEFDARGYVCDDSNLFINQGPPEFRFADRRKALGIPTRPIGGRGTFRGDELWSNAVCADLDNDGGIDVFCNQVYGHLPYSYGLLFMNGGGRFTERHEDAGIKIWGGYGAAAADLDSDGQLDLVICGADKPKGKATVHVFRNTATKDDWIGFDLHESKGQQFVGTKVLLVQEEGVQLRQVTTTMGSHTQQNDGRIHFGLGSQGAILDVVVYWPDGRIQSLGPPKPGRYHDVRKQRSRQRSLRLSRPEKIGFGDAVRLAVNDFGKGVRYYWDFGGSRHSEAITDAPEVHHTFDTAGPHTIWVRAARPRGSAAEARAVLIVTEK